MIKKEYYSFNEIAIISMIIIILRNIYIYFNLNIFLLIGSFFDFVYFNLHMSQYIEIFYTILIITYNILLLLSKKYFNLRIKYKLRKYFMLTNLIILFFYISKEPLFFYSNKKIILVLTFLLAEFILTFFVHKIRIEISSCLLSLIPVPRNIEITAKTVPLIKNLRTNRLYASPP